MLILVSCYIAHLVYYCCCVLFSLNNPMTFFLLCRNAAKASLRRSDKKIRSDLGLSTTGDFKMVLAMAERLQPGIGVFLCGDPKQDQDQMSNILDTFWSQQGAVGRGVRTRCPIYLLKSLLVDKPFSNFIAWWLCCQLINQVIIGSGNDLLPSGSKSLPEPMLT